MKCEENGGCPLAYGNPDWHPGTCQRYGVMPQQCHLTPATFPLIRRLLTGSISEQERVVLEAIGADKWDCYNCKHGEWDTQVVTMQRRYFCDVWNIPNDPDMDMILRPCAAFEPKEQA